MELCQRIKIPPKFVHVGPPVVGTFSLFYKEIAVVINTNLTKCRLDKVAWETAPRSIVI